MAWIRSNKKGSGGGESGSSGHNYSTEEQIVGTWIDGSPIYEKTFVVQNPTSGSTRNILHNITGFSKAIEISGTYTRSDHVDQVIGAVTIESRWCLFVTDVDSTSFNITVGSSISVPEVRVTLKYLKSSSP